MKKLFSVIALIALASTTSFAQTPNFNWGLQVTPNVSNYFSIKTDALNCAYIMGIYYVGIDLDPSPATATLVPKGQNDIYIAKYDPQGNFLWARLMGGTNYDEVRDMDVDIAGNSYITGLMPQSDTLFFQTTSTSFSVIIPEATTQARTFIAKYDANGNYIWSKLLTGTAGGAFSKGIEVSAVNGYLSLTGQFTGDVDFDPSAAVVTLPVLSAGYRNLFIARYDLNGNYIWAKGLVNQQNGNIYDAGLSVDPTGNTYITGVYTIGHIDFDPSPTFTMAATGPTLNVAYGYIAKYDINGDYAWVKYLGANGPNNAIEPEGIRVDASGNSYITGLATNTPDFDPSAASYPIVTNNGDPFLAKYDVNGNFVWAKTLSGPGQDWAYSLDLDNAGDIYITGNATGTADFDPSAGGVQQLTPTSNNIGNAMLAKYDTNGNYIWARLMETNSAGGSRGHDVAAGTNGSIFMAGTFKGVADFDLNGSVATYTTPTTALNFFATRYDQCTAKTTSTITTMSCGSYTLNGQIYTNNGTYTQLLTNAAGCDSLLTLNLTIKQASSNSISQTACVSYAANSQTYTASGVYTQTLTNVAGCDSILTLNLTINQPTSFSFSQNACDSYTLNSQTYTATGIYTQTLTNAQGCDSLLTLNLTIDQVDNTVLQNGLILTANENGATYQWLDCNNANQPLSGEISQSYTASTNGSYAVVITKNSCAKTSTCISINNVGVNEKNNAQNITIYPNPNHGKFSVRYINDMQTYSITDVLGNTLLQAKSDSRDLVIDMENFSNGVYFLKLMFGNGTSSIKRIVVSK